MDLYGFIQVYMDLFGLLRVYHGFMKGLLTHQQALFCGFSTSYHWVRCGAGWMPLRRMATKTKASFSDWQPASRWWKPVEAINDHWAETRSISPKRWLVKLSNSLHWRRETNHKYRKGHFYKSNIILCIYSIWLYIYLFIYIISNPQNDRKETCHRNLLGPRCC